MKKIIIVIIDVLVIGGGIFFYIKETRPELFLNIEEVSAPEVTINTSDWKEFRSEKFGVAFKTPADWNNVEFEDVIGLNVMEYDSFGSIRLSSFVTENELINYFARKEGVSTVNMFFNKNEIKVYTTGTVYYTFIKDRIYQITGDPELIPVILTTLQTI